MAKKEHLLTTSALISLALGLGLALPAQAYYPWWLGYSPLNGSTTRMWLSRSLFNPGNFLRSGVGGYSAPYYLANSLTWNAAYAAGQGFNAVVPGRKSAGNQMWPIGEHGTAGQVVDQISPAKWANRLPNTAVPPNQAITAPAMPDISTGVPAILAGGGDPFFMPLPATLNPDGSAAASPVPASAPVPAPTNATASSPAVPLIAAATEPAPAPNFQRSSETGTNPTAGANPFAQAFVEHVNRKFSGNIQKALSDKQTRGYASALGLLDGQDKVPEITSERAELIKRILEDPKEDPLTKVSTIRLLIKH